MTIYLIINNLGRVIAATLDESYAYDIVDEVPYARDFVEVTLRGAQARTLDVLFRGDL